MDQSNAREMQRGGAYRRLVRNRNFAVLWLGQTLSFIGDYFYMLAIPIMVNKLTGSTLMVGLSTISNALPMLVLGPLAGVFVDRWDRKLTMLVSDLLRGALVLLCLLVRTPEQVWIYYVVGFLMSCVGRFFFPARSALLPLLVPDASDLLVANGLMQIVQTAGLLVGPAVAGFAIELWGEWVAFTVDSVTFFVSAVAILAMAVPPSVETPQDKGRRVAAVWAELREGVVFLFKSRTMTGVLVCMAILQLGIGAINVISVPYLQRTFGIGAKGLGVVDSAQGLGMVVSGAVLGILTARLSRTALVGWGLVIIGIALGGIGLAPSYAVVVGLGFIVGLALTPASSALATLTQLAVPDLKRGRVGSALNAIAMAAGLLSMSAAASLGDTISLRLIYVICGLTSVASGVLALVVLREPDLQEDCSTAAVTGDVESSPT